MSTDERILTIEDTREVNPIQKNYLPLVASKGDQGAARVTIEMLLQASMRLRPDRIFLAKSAAQKLIRSCVQSIPAIRAASRRFTPTAPPGRSNNWP